jgi:hypothetical protein
MTARRFLLTAATLLLSAGTANAVTSIGVVGAAALQGSFGMRVTYDAGGGAAYVQDNSPNAEAIYFAQFRIRVNSTNMGFLASQQIFRAFVDEAPSGTAFRVNLFRNPAGDAQEYAMQVFPFLDGGGTFAPRLAVNIQPDLVDGQQFAIEFRAGTGSANGIMRMYRDGTLRKTQTGLDNDTLRVGMVRFGAPAAPSATSGTVDLDDFISTRTCPGLPCP